MASIKAAQSGNWSSTSTWSGGVVPGVGDDVFANTFTVTIDQDISVNSLQNAANAGISATAGGGFQVTTSGIDVVVGAGIIAAHHGSTTPIITYTHSSGTSTFSTTGGIFSSGSNNYDCITFTGTGILTITGDCPAGGNRGTAVKNTSTGTINLYGNVGASTSLQFGTVQNNGAGTINIFGNLTGSSNGWAVENASTGTVNVTGDVTGGTTSSSSVGSGLKNTSTGSVKVTGNVTGSPSNASAGIYNAAAGSVTVEGNVAAQSGCGIINVSVGGVRIGKVGQQVTITNVGTIPAINGIWMVVTGASIAVSIPTDANWPNYTGAVATLDINGFTTGSGLILLSDISAVLGALLAAAESSP